MNALDEITESFSRLPGIGKKSAARIANHLLRADSVFMARFANQIATLQEKIKAYISDKYIYRSLNDVEIQYSMFGQDSPVYGAIAVFIEKNMF